MFHKRALEDDKGDAGKIVHEKITTEAPTLVRERGAARLFERRTAQTRGPRIIVAVCCSQRT